MYVSIYLIENNCFWHLCMLIPVFVFILYISGTIVSFPVNDMERLYHWHFISGPEVLVIVLIMPRSWLYFIICRRMILRCYLHITCTFILNYLRNIMKSSPLIIILRESSVPCFYFQCHIHQYIVMVKNNQSTVN